MLSRTEFDSFLKLYGIPSSDEKYNQYKKSQVSSLVNQQFAELASQVKQKVTKPTMPSSTVIGPGAMEDRKASMDKYNKQLAEYNRQQNLVKAMIKASANRQKYFEDKEKIGKQKSTGATIPYESPEDIKKLKGNLSSLPKTFSVSTSAQDKAYHDRLEDSYLNYQIHHRPVYDKPVKRIPKPNQIPNTNQHINHNIMSFQEYKNFRFNQGFGVGQVEYKRYLTQFNLNDPTPHLHSQISAENNKQGASSLAKGQSSKDYSKQHSKNIIQHLQNTKTVAPGTIDKVNPPVAIKLHNFQNPTPQHNEHHVDAHSIIKQAGTEAGNPKNAQPKISSGVHEDNHLNPTPQPNPVGPAITSGVKSAIVPQAPAGQIQGETFAEFRARTRPNTTAPPPAQDQDAGDMIL